MALWIRLKMNKGVFLLALLVFPLASWAAYNPVAIKKGVSETESFQIMSWQLSDNGETFIARSGLTGVVLSVGKKSSGIISVLQNLEQGLAAMGNCLLLADIAIVPANEAQRAKIGDVVQSALDSEYSKHVVMHDVRFEVTPVKEMGNIYLSCILSAAE